MMMTDDAADVGAGDTAGAEETKKQFLKGLAQLQRGAQRGAGAAGGAGAGAGKRGGAAAGGSRRRK